MTELLPCGFHRRIWYVAHLEFFRERSPDIPSFSRTHVPISLNPVECLFFTVPLPEFYDFRIKGVNERAEVYKILITDTQNTSVQQMDFYKKEMTYMHEKRNIK